MSVIPPSVKVVLGFVEFVLVVGWGRGVRGRRGHRISLIELQFFGIRLYGKGLNVGGSVYFTSL